MTDMPTVEAYGRATADMANVIGEGRDRITFREPDSFWAYKVAKRPLGNVNYAEFELYKTIIESDAIHMITLPKMVLLPNGVMATEFIDGDRPTYCPMTEHSTHDTFECWENIVNHFESIFNLRDAGSSCNVRVRTLEDGTTKYYVIDLGE